MIEGFIVYSTGIKKQVPNCTVLYVTSDYDEKDENRSLQLSVGFAMEYVQNAPQEAKYDLAQ